MISQYLRYDSSAAEDLLCVRWCCVGCVVPGISKDHSICIYQNKQSKKNVGLINPKHEHTATVSHPRTFCGDLAMWSNCHGSVLCQFWKGASVQFYVCLVCCSQVALRTGIAIVRTAASFWILYTNVLIHVICSLYIVSSGLCVLASLKAQSSSFLVAGLSAMVVKIWSRCASYPVIHIIH